MRKGFTLIEGLVVVAIISIGVAVLMAATANGWLFSRVNPASPKSTCISTVKNIGLGFAMYQNDYDHLPAASRGADTGALGLGLLREHGYMDSDDYFSCPAHTTRPEWKSISAYRNALRRGFKRRGDRWHAGTLGYDYDNTVPAKPEPLRALAADKDTTHHGDGSVVLFADKHAQWLDEGPGKGVVSNPFLADTDIYQGQPGDKEDCWLNGADADDS
mgnify:CR=1 FL=1